ncbi:unnamed protein product [Lactuca virosa]|uniref:Uncharacterized protein n=1 Tax=Lactuca virosa TaxID=75947 RepID=A0AAU9MAZ2_9ASTR|nr:unnamed protein product [Lactuca virosa]
MKSKVKVTKFDANEGSDFEDAQLVVIRKKRMHHISFKDEDEKRVKKVSKKEVVQKRRKNNEGNVGKARKLPKVVDSNAEEPRRIQVRTSPNVLYSCMHKLSEEQKSYISSIGLGHLLNMKVEGCTSIIGHYMVRNFDVNRMVLRLPRGDIPINREVIHELLGLPLGNVAIKSMAYTQVTDDTITVWKKQFDDEDNIKPRAVQQIIIQTTHANLLYKNVDKRCERERVEFRTIGLGMGEMQEPFPVINESAATGNIVHETIQANEAGKRINLSDGSFKGNEPKEDFNGCGNTIEESVQSQWWYDNKAEIERSLILATSRKQFNNSPIPNYSIQMSKDYADIVNGSARKSFDSTPPSKM